MTAMPDKPKPILVPVDFSTHSEAALVFAVRLARCLGEPLLILHVVHDPGSMPGYYSLALKKKQVDRIEDRAAQMLAEFLTAMAARYPDLGELQKPQSLLVKGLPCSRILEVAQHEGASLIVLGSKGLTGLKHLLVGSVAQRVVQLARCPVTVVK
jgi:nucleotide-binding universal stress UspA family protein